MIIARARRAEWLLATIAILVGLAAWMQYLNEGLVLSHYDAKAHLVVARRVIDSVTPGWRQIGAVWLPLPHLVQVLPTQVDLFYRTGAFGSLVSVICFGLTAWALARLVRAISGSVLGAVTGVALLVLNPNLLYLQATPMTELMLLALSLLAVCALYEWVHGDTLDRVPWTLGSLLFLTAWTRYEAWPILVVALMATGWMLWLRDPTPRTVVHRMWRLAAWPGVALILFLLLSRATVGSWFVTGGFYEHDPTYDGQSLKTAIAIWWGTHRLSGYVIELVALTTAVWLGVRAMRTRDASQAIPLALFAAAALPAVAFYGAHPFRIRYMVPMVSACALFCGLAVGLLANAPVRDRVRPAGWMLAIALVVSSLVESPPWQENAPLIAEAQWDAERRAGRTNVTACLAPAYRDDKVLASMDSLAHYMQELSHDGFDIADFIHEGNGTLWDFALETGPARHVGWMLVEEQSEGGDVLAQRSRADTSFTRGMTKVCEGGGVSLYRRD